MRGVVSENSCQLLCVNTDILVDILYLLGHGNNSEGQSGRVAEISLLEMRVRVVTIPVHVNIHLRLWTQAFEEIRLSHDGRLAAKGISNVRMRDEAFSFFFFFQIAKKYQL